MSETKEKYSEKEQKTSASATDDTATKETTEEGVENTPEEKDDTAKPVSYTHLDVYKRQA